MRVLVVDDDADIAVMLARIVTHLGHSVEACSNPTEAIEKLSLLHFDAVISDYMMNPNGVEVLRAFPRAWSILLTASYANTEISAALRAGVVHLVLTKPASLSDLRHALDAAP